jgi:hypothetical protein
MGSRSVRQRYCRCGAHLAADNAERQCADCQRASRDKYLAPPQVPHEFWHTELLREAFAAQHMAGYPAPIACIRIIKRCTDLAASPKVCLVNGWVSSNPRSAGLKLAHPSVIWIR